QVGATTDEQLLRDLVDNNPLKSMGDEVFKVWPTNANRKSFKSVVQHGGPPADKVDDPDNLIEEAYEYFVRRLEQWIAESAGEHDPTVLVKTLRVTLCDLLKTVSITLEQ